MPFLLLPSFIRLTRVNCSVEVKTSRALLTNNKQWGSSALEWKELGDHDDMHSIPQGTDDNERVGRKIAVTKDSHLIRMSCGTHFAPEGSTPYGDPTPLTYESHTNMQFNVRVVGILFFKKNTPFLDPPVAVAAGIDLGGGQDVPSSGVFARQDILSMMDLNFHGYKKFFDKTFRMSMLPSTDGAFYSAATAPNEYVFRVNVPVRTIEYASHNQSGRMFEGIVRGFHQFYIITDQKNVDLDFERNLLLKYTDQ